MFTSKLLFPVHTQDNKLLLSAGTVLSKDTLDALISSNKTKSRLLHSFLRFGSVEKDILHFLGHPPYHEIFSDQKKLSNILHFMDTVYILLPVLQSLDYFKQHDFYTYRHILTVFAMSTLLAGDLLPDYQEMILEVAAVPNHDFGKICVPLNILKKTKPLTRKERSILEHHTIAGYTLFIYYLKKIDTFASRVARDHHERRDGSGYPRGISLVDRMVEIIAVSDVYDALISPRPYRPVSYDNRTALEEITAMAEKKQIGWEVVKALIAYNRKDKPDPLECAVSEEKRGTPPSNNVYGIIDEENINTQDA